MNNIYLYYLIKFFGNFGLTVAIWTFFLTNYNTLNYSQAFFVMLLIGIISFLFEIPSGVWCDKFGRKKVYIYGIIMSIIGYYLWTFFGNFYIFIVAAILKGVGMAMNSGSIEAMVHDELALRNNEKLYYKIQSNGHILMFIARFFGSILAGFLYLKSPQLPYELTILLLFIELILASLINSPRQDLCNTNTFSHYKKSFNFFIENKVLGKIILFLVLYCGFSNIYWFTYQIYFKNINLSIQTIGGIFAMAGLFSAIGSYVIKEIKEKLNDKTIILTIFSLGSFAGILYLFQNIYISIFGVLISSIVAGMIVPFGNSIILQKAHKDNKSTLLSIFAAGITLSFGILNIIVGLLLDKINIIYIYFITVLFIILTGIISLIKIK